MMIILCIYYYRFKFKSIIVVAALLLSAMNKLNSSNQRFTYLPGLCNPGLNPGVTGAKFDILVVQFITD